MYEEGGLFVKAAKQASRRSGCDAMVIEALLDAESGVFCVVDEINNVRKDRTKLEMSDDTGFCLRQRRRRRAWQC